MKKIFFILLLSVLTTTVKAQDEKAIKEAVDKSKYEYAFVYVNIKVDTMYIHYDNGEEEPVSRMTFSNMNKGIGNSYHKVTEGFDKFTTAFKYLEAQRYDFVGTGNYLYGEFNVPYYMFRRRKE